MARQNRELEGALDAIQGLRAGRAGRWWDRPVLPRDDVLLFLVALAFFCVLSLFLLAQLRPDPVRLVRDALLLAPTGVIFFMDSARWFLPLLLLWIVLIPRDHRPQRLTLAIVSLIGCSAFVSVFCLVKGSLAHGTPFHADAVLARLDLILHGGYGPLDLTHLAAPLISPQLVQVSYVTLWLFPAMFLPVGLVLGDSNPRRRLRFVTLYFFVWIGLGILAAFVGMSAGPVYYDRLLGGTTFADLPLMLEQANLGQTVIPQMQERLWQLYAGGNPEGASGIAAFPSVHVGMATVVGLYLIDRWGKVMLLPGLLIPLWYQFLSVYTGWHYAVDGYFSILAVILVWLVLRRTQRQSDPGAVDRPAEAA